MATRNSQLVSRPHSAEVSLPPFPKNLLIVRWLAWLAHRFVFAFSAIAGTARRRGGASGKDWHEAFDV